MYTGDGRVKGVMRHDIGPPRANFQKKLVDRNTIKPKTNDPYQDFDQIIASPLPTGCSTAIVADMQSVKNLTNVD